MRITRNPPPPRPVDKKAIDEAVKKFKEHKKKNPKPVSEKDMTPLQRRMQSGGPSIDPEVEKRLDPEYRASVDLDAN